VNASNFPLAIFSADLLQQHLRKHIEICVIWN